MEKISKETSHKLGQEKAAVDLSSIGKYIKDLPALAKVLGGTAAAGGLGYGGYQLLKPEPAWYEKLGPMVNTFGQQMGAALQQNPEMFGAMANNPMLSPQGQPGMYDSSAYEDPSLNQMAMYDQQLGYSPDNLGTMDLNPYMPSYQY